LVVSLLESVAIVVLCEQLIVYADIKKRE